MRKYLNIMRAESLSSVCIFPYISTADPRTFAKSSAQNLIPRLPHAT